MTLKQMRRVRDYTLQEMADKVGVTVGTYAAWEKCPARCKVGNLMKVLQILGYSITELKLFTGERAVYVDNTVLDFEDVEG